jgi:negative regulator of sigma-B (phosphoserine phosphatase)
MNATLKWPSAPSFDWGVAALTHAGESTSGDRYVVNAYEGGALVAVIDALGHGVEASAAADVAGRVLQQHVRERPGALIEYCHAEMRQTRGAAMSLATLDWRARTMTWIAIGNVTGVLMHADTEMQPRVQALLLRGGVVGDRLPELRPWVTPLLEGDTLLLASDGVQGDFTRMLPTPLDPQPLADRILEQYATRRDDATVLVFRFNGA